MTVMVEQRPGYGPAAPVPMFQWQDEFKQLLALYRKHCPVRVLEVGSYHGGTLYHWLQNANAGSTVVSVDRYDLVDNSHLYDGWCAPGVDCVVIRGDSNSRLTAAKAARRGPFDWVFIDAGHLDHEVRTDWRLYGPLAAPGAVICFHDILPPSEQHPEIQVAALWSEIKATHRTREIVADRSAPWGGIGVVFIP